MAATTSPGPSEIQRGALRLRAALQRVLRRSGALEPDRTACGLPLAPSHAHALMLIGEAREPAMTQRDVALALGLDKSSVARLCQRMVEAEHLEVTRDPENARFVRLRLTAKGARAARAVEEASLARHAALIRAVPRAERARVIAALGVLAAALDAVPAGGGA